MHQEAGKGLRGSAESWRGRVSDSRDAGLWGLECPANWQRVSGPTGKELRRKDAHSGKGRARATAPSMEVSQLGATCRGANINLVPAHPLFGRRAPP